jgi:hypothetical protein
VNPTTIQNLIERGAVSQAANACAKVSDAIERSEDGKLGVTLTFKFTKTNGLVSCVSNWAFSERITGEDEEDSEKIPDPNQPELLQ